MRQRKGTLLLLILPMVFAFTLASINPIVAAEKKDSAKKTINKAKAALNKKLNINKATKDELMMLPSIGEARADAIIKARKKKPFADFKDVVERKIGVGAKIIEDIKPYLKFN